MVGTLEVDVADGAGHIQLVLDSVVDHLTTRLLLMIIISRSCHDSLLFGLVCGLVTHEMVLRQTADAEHNSAIAESGKNELVVVDAQESENAPAANVVVLR